MRGRGIVALLLLGFVLVAVSVIWRRSVGVAQVRRIEQLEQQRADLAARQAALQSEIRDASSRARLARVAEQRLGMRVPSDSHVITLPRPVRRDPP
jgi:cell division protein FtsL